MTHARNDFETQLEALQLLLQKEHSLPEHRKYLMPIHKDIIGLMIVFDEFLRRNMGITNPDVKRDTRLAMLSHILGKEVKTTYDLTIYQCATIASFLREGNKEEGYYTPARATSFLEGCQDRIKSKVNAREREDRILKELGY